MSALDDFKTYVDDLTRASTYTNWAKNHAADATAFTAYYKAILAGQRPDPPTMSTSFGKSIVEVGVLALDAIPPTPPPTSTGTGLGLIAYAGSLKNHTHWNDGSHTYDVVVADWADAARLATADGKGFAYTVTTEADWAASPPTNYVILDPLGNSGLAGALKPDDYIAKCAALKAANPKLHGIFLDNNSVFGRTLMPPVPSATYLDVLQHVSAGLKAAGLSWLSNTASYISGDPGDNDGSLWREWATAIKGDFEYMLFENWQHTPRGVTPQTRRVRGTDAWYKHWDDFQKCVGAVPGQFMAASYQLGGDQMYGTYGRASMLTAAGAHPGNIFYSGSTNSVDPYGQPWQKRNPTPQVDPVAGTASL